MYALCSVLFQIFPCLLVLMTRKDRASYKTLFNYIRTTLVPGWTPEVANVD